MERVEKICLVLKQIRKAANNVIAQALPIMKRIDSKPDQLIAGFIKETDEQFTNKYDIQDTFQQIVLGWIKDAEKVRGEIDNFITLKDGNINLNSDPKVCPFLSEVWSGDTYDKTELEGLTDLLKELNEQFKLVTIENLYETTHKTLYTATQ